MFRLRRYEQPDLGTSSKTDNHLKCGLVDHNLCNVIVGKPDQNGPNADKRYIRSAYTDVMDVLEPSPYNGGIGISGSSPCNDRDGECGGGTGRGVNVTSICGSSGMKVEMV